MVGLLSEVDGLGVVRGALGREVVVVLRPAKDVCAFVTTDRVDRPCINGRLKIWREFQISPSQGGQVLHRCLLFGELN